eukprot:COSAG06_NODE_9686_length_1844_cov_2.033811_2_plen_119_part_00
MSRVALVKATDQGRDEVLDTPPLLRQSNTNMATKLTPTSASSKPNTSRSVCDPVATHTQRVGRRRHSAEGAAADQSSAFQQPFSDNLVPVQIVLRIVPRTSMAMMRYSRVSVSGMESK